MILQDVPTKLPAKDHVKRLVARVLLQHAGDGVTGPRRLAQRDIARITGTDWETVHALLKSLRNEGAIRIERHRIIINKDLLQEVAGYTTVAIG